MQARTASSLTHLGEQPDEASDHPGQAGRVDRRNDLQRAPGDAAVNDARSGVTPRGVVIW